jgi:hypothetical protein
VISECWLLDDQDRVNITMANARAQALFATTDQTETTTEFGKDEKDYEDYEDEEENVNYED